MIQSQPHATPNDVQPAPGSEGKLDRLKTLLSEMFQLDRGDMDFGLYRIMNLKTAEITAFLDNDLLPQVQEKLNLTDNQERIRLEKELQDARKNAKKLGVDPDSTPLVQKLRERLTEMQKDAEAMEIGIWLLHKDGSFLCHIDENEYEALHLLFTNMTIPDGGTIVWDKKNPMLGRKGVATQHEYVLWRTWSESQILRRSKNSRMILAKAQSLILKHGEVNEQVKKEFRDWIVGRRDFTERFHGWRKGIPTS